MIALPSFLRHPIGPAEAVTEIKNRIEKRAANLLKLLRQSIYENPASPYRWLLGQAGCEFGDLERLIERQGVEGALRELFGQGVYLTVDEFKGRQPVVRGSSTLWINPLALRNHRQTVYSAMQSSGTSGSPPTPIPLTLGYARTRAANTCLMLQARQGREWIHAIWGVPGGAAISNLLQLAGSGHRSARWFSQIDPRAPALHPRYRWSARAMRWGSFVAGVPKPAPEHVSLDDPLPIARWMNDVIQSGRVPHLLTFASCAVRVCQAALDSGLSLEGVQFTASGDETLPKKFGGGATDYQLVEEETDDGRSRLRLLVSPAIGPLDSEAVAETFFASIAVGSGAEMIMELQWRDGHLLRVERAVPRNTTRGKILHLYRERTVNR